jgi:hypothetical protein
MKLCQLKLAKIYRWNQYLKGATYFLNQDGAPKQQGWLDGLDQDRYLANAIRDGCRYIAAAGSKDVRHCH